VTDITSPRDLARSRVADLFSIAPEEVRDHATFGVDLRATTRSDFSLNELDRILDDIQEVRQALPTTLGAEDREIATVDDFCALVEGFYESNTKGYMALSGRWEKEASMQGKPVWRRLLHNLVGR
jgi:hypothetical protein